MTKLCKTIYYTQVFSNQDIWTSHDLRHEPKLLLYSTSREFLGYLKNRKSKTLACGQEFLNT